MIRQQSRIVLMIKKQCKHKLTGTKGFFCCQDYFSQLFSHQDEFFYKWEKFSRLKKNNLEIGKLDNDFFLSRLFLKIFSYQDNFSQKM